MNEIMTALQNLFNLPNWENRGDQGDVRQAMQALHAAYKERTEPDYWNTPLFNKCPALKSLSKIQEPKPDHIRSCLLELCRWIEIKSAKVT